MLCLAVSAWGQSGKVTVRGTVSDATGPLPGATVYEKGNMSNGSTSDADGKYTITVPSGATLVISCLGYADIEEKVGSRKVIDVSMKDSFETLAASEVVSVGYGSVARRDLTGSVGKVNMDEIIKSTPMNFDQALAGRVAGVVVTTSDGQVGSEANIVIRGNNSLTQSSAPLYVIDGFPTKVHSLLPSALRTSKASTSSRTPLHQQFMVHVERMASSSLRQSAVPRARPRSISPLHGLPAKSPTRWTC